MEMWAGGFRIHKGQRGESWIRRPLRDFVEHREGRAECGAEGGQCRRDVGGRPPDEADVVGFSRRVRIGVCVRLCAAGEEYVLTQCPR